MKPDRETQKVLSDQEKIKLLTEHDGWGIVRKKLLDKLMDMGSILNIQDLSPDKITVEVAGRQLAFQVLKEWLDEVEGTAQQFKNNSELYKEVKDDYLVRYESDSQTSGE